MKNKLPHGFTLLEVLVAFIVATISVTWFLYVLSHNYSSTTRLFERLKLFDSTTLFRKHLLAEITKNSFSSEEIENLSEDKESLSSYIIPPQDIVLKIKVKEKAARINSLETNIDEWQIILKSEKNKTHLFWQFYQRQREN
ncbi:hypothetical protein Thein_2130 [Thermodesulfatator indicus DSM 15286]|uniref:Prepilin-type N-terminal cleavage/methylation domain-containing protein n=1 Tax=Thermodesulfatator indicus (strain DSM 15286 / JCM 11887 / CIR29812) TaxID=667014 RepID=F8ADG1_THEID|nr:prepilin-type N-terminal cleavage/methylation domain-containing protein [Thermodesulfatator indicus]AEH45978.1 hypothetical protein Thein_2130 [Thermodesulfatator indicus DSM 15286]